MAKHKKNQQHQVVGTRQTTLTLPLPLYQQVMKEAEARGLTYNRYVVSVLEARPLAAVDMQPLVIEMARVRQAVEANANVDIREEVEKLCQFVEFFLAEQIRRIR